MTFVSVLLFSIMLISVQAGKLYNREWTLKDLNQSARGLSDTFGDFGGSQRGRA